MHRRLTTIMMTSLVLAAALSGCGNNSGSTGGGGGGQPSLPAGSTAQAIQARGKLIVGTKFDQPGFGNKSVTSNKIEGFDAEIARRVAERIFGTEGDIESKIEFVETPTPIRETSIIDGKVDIVVATYTIKPERKLKVDFAGPYYVDGQGVMVRKDDTTIKGVEDLAGKKVCTAPGSTSETNLKTKAPKADLSLLFPVYSDCAAALADKRVDAVSTDTGILLGLAAKNEGQFKVVGKAFSDEPYGIGLKKGDDEFRDFLNDTVVRRPSA